MQWEKYQCSGILMNWYLNDARQLLDRWEYYRGIDSAIPFQILQSVSYCVLWQCCHKFRKCPDICTECYFFKIHHECVLWQHWIQTPKQKQNLSRQPVQSCPLCRPIFAKSEMQNYLKNFIFWQFFSKILM